jgi:hypothetical protein
MGALAQVIFEPLQERRAVDLGRERDDRDRVAVEFLVTVRDRTGLTDVGGGLL